MQNLLTKYNNLRQEIWTHLLLPSMYLFWLLFFFIFFIAKGHFPELLCMFFVIITYIYILFVTIFSIIVGFFLEQKVKNKFLLYNKIYGYCWLFGNFLFFVFILIQIAFFFVRLICRLVGLY